jgi:hypothetical protein
MQIKCSEIQFTFSEIHLTFTINKPALQVGDLWHQMVQTSILQIDRHRRDEYLFFKIYL